MLTGDHDYLTTPEDGRRTAEQIKGAEFIETNYIGHFPMSENREVFREYLLQALQTIESRTGTGSTTTNGRRFHNKRSAGRVAGQAAVDKVKTKLA